MATVRTLSDAEERAHNALLGRVRKVRAAPLAKAFALMRDKAPQKPQPNMAQVKGKSGVLLTPGAPGPAGRSKPRKVKRATLKLSRGR